MRFAFLYTIIVSVFVSACTYENLGPEEPTWGTLDVLVNGKKWGERYPGYYQIVRAQKGISGNAIPCQNEYYFLRSELYNRNAWLREDLNFIKTPLVAGKYKVIDFSFVCNETDPVYGSFYTISDDGDVLQDRYDVLESEDNYIVIDSYDPKTLEIRGSFQVTFIIEMRSLNDPSDLADTLRFTNGIFHTKIL